MRPSTIGPRLGRAGVVALLGACAAMVAVSAAPAEDTTRDTRASDFIWVGPGAGASPDDFIWVDSDAASTSDFIWVGPGVGASPDDFIWVDSDAASTSDFIWVSSGADAHPDDFIWV